MGPRLNLTWNGGNHSSAFPHNMVIIDVAVSEKSRCDRQTNTKLILIHKIFWSIVATLAAFLLIGNYQYSCLNKVHLLIRLPMKGNVSLLSPSSTIPKTYTISTVLHHVAVGRLICRFRDPALFAASFLSTSVPRSRVVAVSPCVTYSLPLLPSNQHLYKYMTSTKFFICCCLNDTEIYIGGNLKLSINSGYHFTCTITIQKFEGKFGTEYSQLYFSTEIATFTDPSI